MTGAVLWDLDGTLVDSEGYHWRAWQQIVAAEGFSITHDEFLQTFGLRNDEILPRWLGPGATPARIAAVAQAKEALYRKLVHESGLHALPGAAEWVHRLARQGWRQAIASSAPRDNVEAMIDALGLRACFDVTIAGEDVTAGKPDPQVFLTAAARLGAPPSTCIVVEDAAMGIEAARRARMRSIGVSGKVRLAADCVVSSLTELPQDAFASLLAHPCP